MRFLIDIVFVNASVIVSLRRADGDWHFSFMLGIREANFIPQIQAVIPIIGYFQWLGLLIGVLCGRDEAIESIRGRM